VSAQIEVNSRKVRTVFCVLLKGLQLGLQRPNGSRPGLRQGGRGQNPSHSGVREPRRALPPIYALFPKTFSALKTKIGACPLILTLEAGRTTLTPAEVRGRARDARRPVGCLAQSRFRDGAGGRRTYRRRCYRVRQWPPAPARNDPSSDRPTAKAANGAARARVPSTHLSTIAPSLAKGPSERRGGVLQVLAWPCWSISVLVLDPRFEFRDSVRGGPARFPPPRSVEIRPPMGGCVGRNRPLAKSNPAS
jgi:hypothetical protein